MIDIEDESGSEFEDRGLILARALHDPLGTQGAVIDEEKERDGLFVTSNDIHAYEFTISRSKQKAQKDGEKLAGLVQKVGQQSGNSYKARTGWFVTRDEPTADQRTAISAISAQTGERIHAISISTLHHRICNSELYIQIRKNAPFGSVAFGSANPNTPSVPIRFVSAGSVEHELSEFVEETSKGRRALIVGDYGVGKSHALREIFREKQKRHFRSSKLAQFPVHINLRDCAGLKTPAEILRRHAAEIGFGDADGLISAWRAGACFLLLDGFDEIVPTRWFGNAADLRAVRWEALNPVRRLVTETPANSGIIVAGRSHYFAGQSEMIETLGFKNYDIYSIPDFNEEQLNEYMLQSNIDWEVPDWVPMRPLLLGYLVALGAVEASGVASAVNRAYGWRRFLTLMCEREAQMFSAVRPEIIQSLISRVATLARSRVDVTGPIDMDILGSAFVDVNGYQPDEEGIQLLLRLPGLAQDASQSTESRMFVDRDLADTAYGLDLASYVLNPYDDVHPLRSVASWANACKDLGIEVCATELEEQQGLERARASLISALSDRNNGEKFDAVAADLVQVAATVSNGTERVGSSFHVSGTFFEHMVLDDSTLLGATTFSECVFSRLDLSGVDEKSRIPHFSNCLIDYIDGASALPEWLQPRFVNCEIGHYSDSATTTAGIMHLALDRDRRIALSILKKIYLQRGSGRKEGALSRGLPLSDREAVPDVISEMLSQGWIVRSGGGSTPIYIGVKSRRAAALQALEFPTEFRL